MAKAATATVKTVTEKSVQISAPNLRIIHLSIRGTAPFVQNKFSAKALQQIHDTQEAGAQAKSKKKREAKDFKASYEGAMRVSTEGWNGIAAPAFRNACISACRLIGFKMTLAKLSIFIEADGYDRDDGMPMVRFTSGEPEYAEHAVRNATGVVDLRARPMWRKWTADLRVKYDADQFSVQDVTNLFMRVGAQVGVGEGRNDSKASAGMGWGSFELFNADELSRAAE